MFTFGSSHFLKLKVGVGYYLTIVKDEACNTKKLEGTVFKHV